MIIFRTFYNKKTFDYLKKYLFTTYQGQPNKIQIESDYSFIFVDDSRKREIGNYRILEIAKSEKTRIRLLPDTKTIGFWERIISISVDGFDNNSIRIVTNKSLVEIHKTNDTEHQKITEF